MAPYQISAKLHDVVNPEGLRLDGRRPGELRRIVGDINVAPEADGSALLQQGQTKILVKVFGPSEARGRSNGLGIRVDIINAPYAGIERRNRPDRRILEMGSILEEAFKEVIICHLYPRSSIDIQVSILCNDGGVLHTCVNAITLALIDAGVPMIDFLCASSAACVEKQAVLDLNSLEEGGNFDLPKFTVGILPRNGQVVLLNLECRMSMDKFELVKDLALLGASQIRDVLDEIVRKNLEER